MNPLLEPLNPDEPERARDSGGTPTYTSLVTAAAASNATPDRILGRRLRPER